jgi:hypothetical protein
LVLASCGHAGGSVKARNGAFQGVTGAGAAKRSGPIGGAA